MISAPTLRDVQMVHADPFGEDMLRMLRADLADAIWVRFMVCYFNEDGLAALSPSLTEAMRHPRSRGLITLTCSCGYDAVWKLARQIKAPLGRLRAFLPYDSDGRDDAKLLHSKMVLIVRPRAKQGPFETPLEAVLYIGSHNWTGPGLRQNGGPRSRRNVETSVRVVADWNPELESEWLADSEVPGRSASGNPILDAITQMHRCFELASNTDLGTPGAHRELDGWMRANCSGEVEPPGTTPFIVLTGVLAGEVDGPEAQTGRAPTVTGRGRAPRAGDELFVQHYNSGGEPEVFDSSVTWAILLWESRKQLERGEQPWLLLGRARNLGQEGSGDPNLRSVQWLAYDPAQNSPAGAPHRGRRGSSKKPQRQDVHPMHLRSGSVLEVEYWSVAPVKAGTTSGQLNARAPDRHVLVEVIEARAPETWDDDEPTVLRLEAPWRGTEIPFHRGKRRKRRRVYLVHDKDGTPSWHRAEAMRDEQLRLFGGVGGPSPHSSATGPTGAPEYAEGDVYSCEAPINDLLFRRYQQEAVLAPRLDDTENPVLFEITRSEDDILTEARSVPRMERLIAPGVPYVALALGLDDIVLSRLGLRR